MNVEATVVSGPVSGPPPPSEDDLDWGLRKADLYLGRVGYQDPIWPVYFQAMNARENDGRDYYAEEEIFNLMVVEYVMEL